MIFKLFDAKDPKGDDLLVRHPVCKHKGSCVKIYLYSVWKI